MLCPFGDGGSCTHNQGTLCDKLFSSHSRGPFSVSPTWRPQNPDRPTPGGPRGPGLSCACHTPCLLGFSTVAPSPAPGALASLSFCPLPTGSLSRSPWLAVTHSAGSNKADVGFGALGEPENTELGRVVARDQGALRLHGHCQFHSFPALPEILQTRKLSCSRIVGRRTCSFVPRRLWLLLVVWAPSGCALSTVSEWSCGHRPSVSMWNRPFALQPRISGLWLHSGPGALLAHPRGSEPP